MVCSNYEMLSHAEKITLIGEVVHILQSSNKYFNILTKAVNEAHKDGIMEGVIVLPPNEFNTNDTVYYTVLTLGNNGTHSFIQVEAKIETADNESKTALINYNYPTSGPLQRRIVPFSEIKKIPLQSNPQQEY